MSGARDPSAVGVELRGMRNAGYVACLVGVLAMIAGRFMPGAPVWAVYAGVGVIAIGWGLFACFMLKRAALARVQSLGSNG